MSNLPAVREGYSAEEIELIKSTIAKDTTDQELQLFMYQCKRTGLDPFSRQIHAVKRRNNATGRDEMAIQTGIDGYRLIADRTGKYAGNDDFEYGPEVNGYPSWARATVWKIVSGQRVAFSATARWKEYAQTKRDGKLTHFWNSKPYIMLGKCAESMALRKAFPQELSGLYTHEEMGQADNEIIDVEPVRHIEAEATPAEPEQEPEPQQQAPASSGKRDKMLSRILDLMTWIGEKTDGKRYNEHHLKNKLKQLFDVYNLADMTDNQLIEFGKSLSAEHDLLKEGN